MTVELADQLTPEQVAEIEYMEREHIPPRVTAEQGHLNYARTGRGPQSRVGSARPASPHPAAPVDR